MKTSSAVKEREAIPETPETPGMQRTERASSTSPRRDPYLYSTLVALRRDLNHIVEDLTRGVEAWRPHFVEPIFGDFVARVDFKDTEKECVAYIEIPGVDYRDVEVILGPEFLTVKGEKREEKESCDKGYFRAERRFGAFQRILPLPYKVDREHVEAIHKNGVLKIVMPKTSEEINGVQKINIKHVGS